MPNSQQAAIATPLCDDYDSTIRFTVSTCHPCLVIPLQPEAILVCIFALAQSLKWPIRGLFSQGDARCHPPTLIYPCTSGLRTYFKASIFVYFYENFSLSFIRTIVFCPPAIFHFSSPTIYTMNHISRAIPRDVNAPG